MGSKYTSHSLKGWAKTYFIFSSPPIINYYTCKVLIHCCLPCLVLQKHMQYFISMLVTLGACLTKSILTPDRNFLSVKPDLSQITWHCCKSYKVKLGGSTRSCSILNNTAQRNILSSSIHMLLYQVTYGDRKMVYSQTCEETTATRDRSPTRDHFSSNMAPHFYTFVPPMKGHLSYKTTFSDPMGYICIDLFSII